MMSISNTRLHLLLTLMQSEVTGNHACPLQLIRLYFPGAGRNTTETQKFFTITAESSCAHWLIFIVNKRTDT